MGDPDLAINGHGSAPLIRRLGQCSTALYIGTFNTVGYL